MFTLKIAILTSKSQWFECYALTLSKKLGNIPIYCKHEDIYINYDIVFILSYHRIVPKEMLEKNKHNIVIHESLLPKGKGWAPLFWQVLKGKKIIPFTMFEASKGIDDGDIYMQKNLNLTGYELNNELREKQADVIMKMCLDFVGSYEKYKVPSKQTGAESFYKKRGKGDSRLDIDKTIKDQFNLLRIVNNDEYPAFFELDGNRYILKIELDESEFFWGGVELIDFVDLTLQEKLMVLNWRNDNVIKQWMYSQDDISVNKHLNFIETLRLSLNKQYLVVKKKDEFLGIVYFTNIDFDKEQSYFGLYSNPNERVSGVGVALEEVCSKYIFKLLMLNKIKLEVLSNNKRAINLYKKSGYREAGIRNINNKRVVCMQRIKNA